MNMGISTEQLDTQKLMGRGAQAAEGNMRESIARFSTTLSQKKAWRKRLGSIQDNGEDRNNFYNAVCMNKLCSGQ